MNALIATRIVYILIDLTLVLGFVHFSGTIQSIYGSHSLSYALLVLGIVIALGIALTLESKQKDRINKFQFALVGLSATGFAILNVFISLEIIGLDNLDAISTVGITLLSVLWITTISIYLAGVLPRTTATREELLEGIATQADTTTESVHNKISLLKTTLVGVLSAIAILITSAYWEFKLFGAEDTVLEFNDKLLTMLWAYPLFFLFFASPRLLTLTKKISWYTAVSAALSIGYIVWHSIS